VKIEQFIVGPLTTVLKPGEILVQVRVPVPAARTGSAYEKLPHPASRFAVVGVAAAVALDAKGGVQTARVALTGLAPKVTRAGFVEQALQGKGTDSASLKAAASHAAEGIQLRADLIGSADYRAHLAAVFTERALRRAVARALER
jgi:carbon-monoxide dehydrogenase medium subunit